jgi:FkbM family methyltransferase
MKPFHEDDRYDYPLTPDSVVIDLGCYEGTFAAKIHEKYGCRVFAFEPVPSFFDRCAQRFNGHTPKVLVLNLAVGGEDGEVEGRIKGDMSGLFADQGEPWKSRMIRGVGMFALLDLDEVDLLKINIEGGEFDLLEDLIESAVLHRFRNIQVQWHDVVPDAITRYKNLQGSLSESHHLTFDHGWVWQNWRRNDL